MGDAADDHHRVLIVDDEKEVADAYALTLGGHYDVETVYGGEAALEAVTPAVDVVLLDRRMPRVSGDDVLAEIRDRELPCRVVLLTAVDPDFDIVDMPFDDYLCKPVPDEDLVDVVDQQVRIAAYERLGEYFRLASKREVLHAQLPASRREAHDEYRAIERRTAALREELSTAVDGFDALLERFEAVDRATEV